MAPARADDPPKLFVETCVEMLTPACEGRDPDEQSEKLWHGSPFNWIHRLATWERMQYCKHQGAPKGDGFLRDQVPGGRSP
jgi:hypothetical protein